MIFVNLSRRELGTRTRLQYRVCRTRTVGTRHRIPSQRCRWRATTRNATTDEAIEETETKTLQLSMAGTNTISATTWAIEPATVPFWLSTPLTGSVAANEETTSWVIQGSTRGLAMSSTP